MKRSNYIYILTAIIVFSIIFRNDISKVFARAAGRLDNTKDAFVSDVAFDLGSDKDQQVMPVTFYLFFRHQ